MKAILKNYRMSPRKVRLLANFVRGKEVNKILTSLNFINKKASSPIYKLIKSAQANAQNNSSQDISNLIVQTIIVEEGVCLKRIRPSSRGRAKRIKKRSSTIRLELASKI